MARTSAAGRRTCFLIIVLLLLAAVLMGYQYLFPAPKGQTAHVFVDGKEAASFPLNKDLEYRVSGADGGTNLLIIQDGQIWCQEADCPDKNCVRQGKKQLSKPPQGKQSLKQLMKQNAGVSNIEITEGNIKAFESTAKKYGIDFALKKDATESPPRYLVFFKGRDADVLTAAFKEFSAKKLTQEKKPSIRKLLSTLKEAAQGRNAERAKVKNKDREVSL